MVGGIHNVLAGCRCAVGDGDVFRMMGYPAPASASEAVRDLALEQVRRLDDLIDPWGSTCAVVIEGVEDERVRLESGRTLTGYRLAAILRGAVRLEICLVTAGGRVTLEVRRLVAAGAMIEALALDAAASAATKLLMAQIRERICGEARAHNWGTTIPYGPGYTGWRIEDTPTLFSCFEGEALPVRINEQFMMTPEKSLLSVIGIGPAGRAFPPEVDPCRLCDLERCSLRQAPYRPDRMAHREESR